MAARLATQRLSSATFSPWIVIDHYANSFAVGLGVKLSSNGNLTYSVQHTFDDVSRFFQPSGSLTRVTTTATVPITNHGLSIGDWITITGAGSPFDGNYAVAGITDQNNITVTVLNTGPTSAFMGPVRVATGRIFNHETLVTQTASGDGNYIAPPFACRLIVSVYSAGYVDLNVLQSGAGHS